MFDWLFDPGALAGLATLIVLEIVLGVDNLIFVAILANRLPPERRDRARIVGLSLALVMRLGLLAGISWLTRLTAPLFTLLGHGFSARDVILAAGGAFLIYKATTELHERLEGADGPAAAGGRGRAVFWQVIAQIIVLDLVFSLDSVITAVGMVNDLPVMITAVVLAVAVMILASGPLMRFVNAHPTVVMLCLGFLLMIGFSLVVESFGLHIPKGYLYAAIGFSIGIEALNQLSRRNRIREAARGDLRERTADAVLRLLGGDAAAPEEVAALAASSAARTGDGPFQAAERALVSGVLDLAARPVRSAMTPSPRVVWLDVEAPADVLRRRIVESGYSHFPVARGGLDDLVGVAPAHEIVRALIEQGRLDPAGIDRKPLVVHEGMPVLGLVEAMRERRTPIAIVTDEFGAVVGVATEGDILEAIVGGLGGADVPGIDAESGLVADGGMDLRRIGQALGVDLAHETHGAATLAGYLLHHFGRVPEPGESLRTGGLSFEVIEADTRRIRAVRIRREAAETHH
ncbi:TerC family protein [Salinarimonas soli]|uniref:CBS domain-containing protein n=1 Tax=Salinarimonas soli TaxID=1638099 RepID=A0A5B2VGG5_9HYPH|nr:transporter associated domain-containing protein [Salinarimonas soli]KAA2237429.1 CBS domain-containing protein [Salinarimonas soli]